MKCVQYIFGVIAFLLISTLNTALIAQESNALDKRAACEILSLEEIADLLDVDANELKQKDLSFGKSRSICSYYTSEGNRKFFIRLSWKSKKATANKVLERNFKKYLDSGDNDSNQYVEIETTSEHQLIYGTGTDRENKSIQVIRKRIGNDAEIQLELIKEYRDEAVKDLLLGVLSKL